MSRLQIKLTKQQLDPQQIDWVRDERQLSYPIIIELKSNINLDNIEDIEDTNFGYNANILVLQLSGVGFDPNQGDVFVKVADVTDIYELANEENFELMNSNSDIYKTSYYRVNRVELACRSVEEVDHVWQVMQSEIEKFVKNYNLQQNLKTETNNNNLVEEVII